MANPWERQNPLFLRVAMLVVVGALLALLVYRQIDRWRGSVLTVWLAASDLEPGTRIAAEHLTPVQVRQRSVPEGTLVDGRAIEGWDLVRAKAAGSPFVAGDLRRPAPDPGPGLAGIVPEGRVLMTVNLPGVPVAELAESWRFGDRFDLFTAAGTSATQSGLIHVARDAVFLGWVEPREPEAGGSGDGDGGGDGLLSGLTEAAQVASVGGRRSSPSPLLLGVRPQDVRRLVWAQAARAPLSVILHGRKEVEKGELLVLSESELAEIEIITGASRQRMTLQEPR